MQDVPLERILGGVGRMDGTVRRVLLESLIISLLLTLAESVIQVCIAFPGVDSPLRPFHTKGDVDIRVGTASVQHGWRAV